MWESWDLFPTIDVTLPFTGLIQSLLLQRTWLKLRAYLKRDANNSTDGKGRPKGNYILKGYINKRPSGNTTGSFPKSGTEFRSPISGSHCCGALVSLIYSYWGLHQIIQVWNTLRHSPSSWTWLYLLIHRKSCPNFVFHWPWGLMGSSWSVPWHHSCGTNGPRFSPKSSG